MSLAYFPMFPTDFDADTGHLSFAEDGAYNRLLRLSWRCPEAKMPDDLEWICRRARAISEEDKALVSAVLNEFFTRKSGKVFSARLHKEWMQANAAHEKRVSAGKSGGRAKSLKTKEPEPSNATPMPEQCSSNQNQNHITASAVVERERSPAATPPGENSGDRVALLEAMGIGPDGITGPSSFIGTTADMADAATWSAMGLTLAEQLGVIRDACGRQRLKQPDWMPRRFGYFTGAMQDFAARRDQPIAAARPQPSSDIDSKINRWNKIAGQA